MQTTDRDARRRKKIEQAQHKYELQEVVTIAQLQELEPLARDMHQENGPHLSFDFDALIARTKIYLDDIERNQYNGWVAYREGKPIGFCMAYITPFWFSNDLGAQTQFIFVDKKHRHTYVPFLLIREFLRWAAIRGVVRYVLDTSIHKDLPKFTKLADKLGFHPAGAYFIKDHYHA